MENIFMGLTSGVTIFIYTRSLLVIVIEVEALFPGKMRQVLTKIRAIQ